MNNVQSGMDLGEAMTTNIDAAPIISGAVTGALVVVATPIVVAAASELLAGAAVTVGSTALMEASIVTGTAATGMATTLYGPISGTLDRARAAITSVQRLLSGPSRMEIGNQFHYDELNGSFGTGGPSQLQELYPDTEIEFASRGQAGVDATITGGTHPSQYPNSTWPAGVDYADFKPMTTSGQITFFEEIKNGKLPANTFPLYYNPDRFRLIKENLFFQAY